MDNFCPLPFGHTAISTNGNFGICCTHYPPSDQLVNINHHDYKTWADSLYVKEIQDSFKQGIKHPGCKQCWNLEAVGQQSMRQQVSTEYKILKIVEPTPAVSPVSVEIQLGNLCNLKCLMCCEQDSSAILQENQRLGINLSNQQDYDWGDDAFKNLNSLLSTKPKVINIRGGEPFYNKNLLKLVTDLSDRGICTDTMLHITTNATVINSQWCQVLEKFRLVRLMVSVDATDELYEYMRFPAKWNTVAKNIKSLQKYKNFNVVLNAVVQNLNVSKIGSLVNWAKEQNLHLRLAPLVGQKHLAITNLPHQLKQQAISHLEDILCNNCPKNLVPFLKTCHQQLIQALADKFDENAWAEFQLNIDMRDRIRKNSHRDFLSY